MSKPFHILIAKTLAHINSVKILNGKCEYVYTEHDYSA